MQTSKENGYNSTTPCDTIIKSIKIKYRLKQSI